MVRVTPAYFDGAYGLPVAMSARPSVQRSRSWGVASQRSIGLERGKMMGRSTLAAIVRTAFSPNSPHWAETPRSTLAPVASSTASGEMRPDSSRRKLATASNGWAYTRCPRVRSGIRSVDEALAVHEEEPPAGLVGGKALVAHRLEEVGGEPDPGAARSGDDDLLISEAAAGHPQRAGERRHDHRRGALDVVVERAELVPVPLQQRRGVIAREVLPLEQHTGEHPLHRGDEAIHEVEVGVSAHPLVSPSDVVRLPELPVVVGTDVEQDGEVGEGLTPPKSV